MVADCYFLPSKSRAYSRKVAFKINGNYYKFATLRGRGTTVKVFNIGCTLGVCMLLNHLLSCRLSWLIPKIKY